MAKAKKTKEAPKPRYTLLPEADMPETVTVLMHKHGSKYMALRQHIGSGEIEGQKIEMAYNIACGGPIIVIGGVYYEGNMSKMVQAVYGQMTVEETETKRKLIEQYQQLVALRKAATKGPWAVGNCSPSQWQQYGVMSTSELADVVVGDVGESLTNEQAQDNAAFIAALGTFDFEAFSAAIGISHE